MNNKEAMQKLTEYFMECADKETLAYAMASMVIDNNRWVHLSELPEDEAENLIARAKKNSESTIEFLKHGKKTPFGVRKVSCIADIE